jgi:hypothetical protein
MAKNDPSRQCPVQDPIKLICPYCSSLVEVPMCQAVNGETIACPHCHSDFEFQQ